MIGIDLLGADQVLTIPSVGQNYTDAKTVAAVQDALNSKRGESLVVDGILGPKTKTAIKKLQASVGADDNGRIDETVISALQVTPGVLPKGVSLQDRAALQAQVALDAATDAEHATSGDDLAQAAQATLDASNAAAPPPPPDVVANAQAALAKAKSSSTPAEVAAAAKEVKSAALAVHNSVKPSWWVLPAWEGGYERWKTALVALGGAGLAYLLVHLFGKKKKR